jgi:peroxiredoxin
VCWVEVFFTSETIQEVEDIICSVVCISKDIPCAAKKVFPLATATSNLFLPS